MGYTKVSISSPNDFIEALSAYSASCGWTVLADSDSLPIDGSATIDGKLLAIKSPDNNVYAYFRSANGKNVLKTQSGSYRYGVALVCATNYTVNPPSGLWYDQPGATKNSAQEVVGVGIPLPQATACNVYFNHISDPSELIIASVEVLPGVFQHIAVGYLYKTGTWTGGTIYSASQPSSTMFPAGLSQSEIESTACELFGMNPIANTFLRANIDAAPLRIPEVLWAGSGPSGNVGSTGKRLGSSIVHRNTLADATIPKIPHYGYLQSQTANDSGRNVNTLNCISVNLPLAIYVLRDPDGLENYSHCGYIPGAYFISMKNLSPASIYAVDYPTSGTRYQAFPQTSRGGILGYDGLAIRQ